MTGAVRKVSLGNLKNSGTRAAVLAEGLATRLTHLDIGTRFKNRVFSNHLGFL